MFKFIEKRCYDVYNRDSIFRISKDNEAFLQRMSLLRSLDVHRGCVNSVVWDDSGRFLLSGADDQRLVISFPWNGRMFRKLRTSHRANIFSAKFIPCSSNKQIVSCSGSGVIAFADLDQYNESYDQKFTCHAETCYDVITLPGDPYTFMSCSEDGTVRWFDLRVKTSCSVQDCKEDILLNMDRAVTSIAINPKSNFELAVSTLDSTVHIFDRRMLGTKAQDAYLNDMNKALLMRLQPEGLSGKRRRVTSLRYSPNGNEVLASFSSDYLYLFDVKNYTQMCLKGLSNSESGLFGDSGPTLKRLRLRGDWSDTGPLAVPNSQTTRQAEEVGQVRPYLQSTLMQRMTDVLCRMLHTTSQRAENQDEDIQNDTSTQDDGATQHVFPPWDVSSADRSGSEEVNMVPASTEDISSQSQNEPSTSGYQVEIPSQSRDEPSSSGSQGEIPSQISSQSISTNSPDIPVLAYKEAVVPCEVHESPPKRVKDDTASSTLSSHARLTDSVPVMSTNLSDGDEAGGSSIGSQSLSNRISLDDNVMSHSSDSSNPSRDTSCQRERGGRPSLSRIVNKVIIRNREEKSSREEGCDYDDGRLIYYGKQLQQYRGHRNARTMIKEACFWGDNHVMSGSDCGRVFVWNKNNGKIVMFWEADRHVVNCLQPHPFLPYLATSGIDYDVKLWAPLAEDASFDPETAEKICKQNEELLTETRDTVTVPATFMIRMLATLNHLRRSRVRGRNLGDEGDDEDDLMYDENEELE